MAADDEHSAENQFREMLNAFLSGADGLDPAELARAAGLPNDPALLAQMMSQLQGVMSSASDGIDWSVATRQAKSIANPATTEVTVKQHAALDQALTLANLWLGEVTSIAELPSPAKLLTRTEWIGLTMPIWRELAEPVALSIADALTAVVQENVPEEMAGIGDAGTLLRNLGGTLFAIQLGQVIGQLSADVVSGGDAGIPLIDTAALLPQNVDAFADGLEIDLDQVRLYLAVRELAHARLFRHARWLRLHLLSAIGDFARGIRVDAEKIGDLAERFDPSNPEELRNAVANGALIAPKSPAQQAALARLETTLALIEGWVDVVTEQATLRLPKADSVAETVRRRRAVGGPAESAFGTLVGLELRPRKMREAAALWRAVSQSIGAEARDALWYHPDLLPTADDLDNPAALIARLTAPAQEMDAMDRALQDLLDEEPPTAGGS